MIVLPAIYILVPHECDSLQLLADLWQTPGLLGSTSKYTCPVQHPGDLAVESSGLAARFVLFQKVPPVLLM